ncbi:putative polysaccharide biosynthesis protein [Alkalilimnicola ehrlichii MLHE-1]|uniref:Putative polysaccharide biosynthesis protein n=2 Tax=Alkalilimnicola ehrlichii TaxID=351052 RepID=Q0A672_ALKEH|nr:putative polysaccharide biosynthesis protein [Alkalilimnicola ehrlichii MLHE-1]
MAVAAQHRTTTGGMRVAFRVDASLAIGSGHVMRCLTLAGALCEQGADCHFLCREPQGHLNSQIAERGFAVHRLPAVEDGSITSPAGSGRSASVDDEPPQPKHAEWLQTTQATDARQSLETLRELAPDWLIVDHYALDAQWEARVREAIPGMRVMVIDDLADRLHQADLLLDQNLGRKAEDYRDLVPAHCRLLVGPKYALLRPEFAEWREWSLERRQENGPVRRLLVSLGGVDRDNVTGQVLDALSEVELSKEMEITVVMGASAPWLEAVRGRARQMPCSTEVVVNVDDMARRMAEANLAIGAAGSTAWERCCLGLPTIVLVLAENQREIARSLHRAGVAHSLGAPDALFDLVGQWPMITQPEYLKGLSRKAASLVDGRGAVRVRNGLMGVEMANEANDG